ncbi:2OG-Fe(II)-dependent halogenase WelO5 family protein [Streptomyces kronopolitis]|uniref:2OG-Fe(II)-dependent halogenase WelO5 family protein n=1 Tax=Streptomyces kronopolitis TaxID=1612435 RepID=UPI003D97D1B8
MQQSTTRLSGQQADPEFFRFEERGELDYELVLDVLHGRRLGVIFRDVIPPAARKDLTERFWASPARHHREGEPSHYVGAYHWNKDVDTYLDESAAVAEHVQQVIDAPDSPWHVFRQGVNEALGQEGASLRVAQMNGRSACAALIRAWDKEGDFSLDPHEDEAQCKDPRQHGFEVQRVLDHQICAVNMCTEHTAGGRLVIWNIRPDDATRRSLGIEQTGLPYQAADLADFEELRLDIREGDVYAFNGAFVHAVDANAGNRTTVSFIMGFTDPRTVVSWT